MSRTVRSRKAPAPSAPACAACGLAAQEVTHCRLPLPGPVVWAAWCADEIGGGGEAGDPALGEPAPGEPAPGDPAGGACALQPARHSAANRVTTTPVNVLITSPSPSRPREQIRPFRA